MSVLIELSSKQSQEGSCDDTFMETYFEAIFLILGTGPAHVVQNSVQSFCR